MANRDGNRAFDFDIEEILLQNGMVEDLLYLEDLRQRKLYLTSSINEDTTGPITRHIFQFNKDDRGMPIEKRLPIILYMSSAGGSVDAGYQLIDAIQASKTPVYTVNIGYWYSMALLIGIAGHKRFSLKNAKFLLHDGTNFVYDSGAKVQDRLEFNKREEARTREYILGETKITPEEYDSKYRTEWYMFAEEAKEKGFIDYIVGDGDCDVDNIV